MSSYKLDGLLSFPFIVLDLDYSVTFCAIGHLRSYSHHGIGGRDTTLLATMKRLGFNKTMTNDEFFKRLDRLETLDPVQRK